MIIRNIGNSLSHILPELIGQDISSVFDLTRPLVEFKFASVRLEHFIIEKQFSLSKNVIDWTLVSQFQILKRTNNIFELVSQKSLGSNCVGENEHEDEFQQPNRKIYLKGKRQYYYETLFIRLFLPLDQIGQMLYMEEWRMIVFLGTPQMNDLDAMIRVGLYINDLSMHDFSR